MGSRGRSIRLRIYFLVAIPLIAMVGLLAYVAGTSVNNAVNLDRAPDLINATSLPTASYVRFLQDERAAAVVYLFRPTPANVAAYQAAVKASNADQPDFLAAMTSPGTKNSENAAEAQGIRAVIAGLAKLPELRAAVTGRLLTPLQALEAYSQGIQYEPKLFLAEADSMTDATAASQGLGLIALVSAHEALAQEYALLSGVLAAQHITQADRAAFAETVANRQGYLVDAEALLDPANQAIYNKEVNNAAQARLAQIEGAVAVGTRVAALPITLAQWQGLAGQLLEQYFTGGVNVAANQLAAARQIANDARNRVFITGAIGLVGLLLTIVVTILVGRSIIRRLGGLERNALQLAEVQLPDVVSRLRRGENVDVNAEAPPLRVGQDEIGRVGQAFELVRETAIRAAVEESRLRQGLNDVFRSLARRSQSLLHRQLTLLDQMERRATDPEALDDLFRLDHLTTRMRRHAEGLVILAGAPPGRGWSSPVRMVDVIRGAIAEVEDYARVSVATRSQAALTGSAVADVIHLLAELIENATMLSPPYTSVRVSGDTVANGFAIEVEDRGLGMSPARLAELNERLANPPEFNPSDSEQLGLFVVSQLAKRHGIKVAVKASPYGGTSAIVLIPRHLVVTEEAFLAGLPGEPASVTLAQVAADGNHAVPSIPPVRAFPAELSGHGGMTFTEIGDGLPGLAQSPGVRICGSLRRSQGMLPERTDRGAHAAPAPGATDDAPGTGPDDAPGTGPDGVLKRHHDQPGGPADPGQVASGAAAGASPGFDAFMPRRHAGAADEPAAADAAAWPAGPGPGHGSYLASPPYPAADSSPYPGAVPGSGGGASPFSGTGSPRFPGSGSPPQADQPASFPGWTLHATPGAAGGRSAPGAAGGRSARGPAAPVVRALAAGPAAPERSGRPPWELSRETAARPAEPGGSAPGPDPAGPDGNADVKGLPRRVKQAHLAPQLRADPPQRRTTVASAGLSGGPTPTEIRQTMSALQRGWQQGRSQRMTDPAPPGSGPAAPDRAAAPGDGPASPLPMASPGSFSGKGRDFSGKPDDSTADEEAFGDSGGS